MERGDLVVFQGCAQQGKVGIITSAGSDRQQIAGHRLYWVLCDAGVLCFTGNQLVLADNLWSAVT